MSRRKKMHRQDSKQIAYRELRLPENDVVQNKTSSDRFLDISSDYLDEHHIWDLFNELMEKLAIDQPQDPISFLMKELKRPRAVLKVLVLGCPGSGKTTISNYISEHFNLLKVSTGDLLREEIRRGSTVGKTARSFLDKGDPVPDNLVVPLLKAAVETEECKNRGWIIEGYPLNREQGSVMLRNGILPNKIILLDLQKEVAKERILTRLVDSQTGRVYNSNALSQIEDAELRKRLQHYNKNQDETAIERAMSSYFSNVNSTVDLFKESMHLVSSDQEPDAVWEQVKSFLLKRLLTNAPVQPPRIICIGAPGTGRTTFTQELARDLSIVRISPGDILKDQILKGTEIGKFAESHIKMCQPVPDDVVSTLLRDKLLSRETSSRGWILDGFPNNRSQAQALISWNVVPRRCVLLEASEDVLVQRLVGRRVDPVTNRVYHIDDNPPPAGEVAQRCVQRDEDSPELVQRSIRESLRGLKEVKDIYQDLLITLDTAQPNRAVYEHMKYFCTSALPLNLGNKSEKTTFPKVVPQTSVIS